jgi:GntR family transcriptional regulator/MocR family aminotransferase
VFDLRSVAGASTPVGPPEARYLLSAGVPDTRLFPHAIVARAYRRALHAPGARGALDYADPCGAPRLRAAIAAMLRETRGIPAAAEHVMITRGSQLAIDLAARLLVRPGDVAAVEELGYQPAWRALAEAGARLSPVALDGAGLVVESLARLSPRCLYTTPHHQYPTTVLMSPARRIALLAHARAHRIAILEDDYDHELHFDGRPVAPLAADDRGACVIYIGTLSKILAPGLRLGFIVAPACVIEQLSRLRFLTDRQGDHVLEHAIAELIEEGELQRHARKMRRIYEQRRDALVATLHRELAGALSFELPAGGMTLWARVDRSIRLEAWRQRALERGVSVATARDFDLERRPRPFLRLAFARHDEAELAEAVRRLRRALPSANATAPARVTARAES